MSILFGILLFVFTSLAMEAWAWFMHKYFLHGPLWFLHKSHHQVNPGWFEWNDLVALGYGIVATALIVLGAERLSWQLPVGLGISFYGIVYFYFHDIIIHRRVKVRYRFTHAYVNRLIRAHKIHHKHQGRKDSEAFGFLYAPKKYRLKRVAKPSRKGR